jgi:hypothetical protein
MPRETGPFVTAATFCEKLLIEQDGVLSAIRLVDRLQITARGHEAPEQLPEGGKVKLTLLVALKSGDARGRHAIAIRPQAPSGLNLPEHSLDVMFEGEDRGVNLVIELELDAIEGLYWFDVSCGVQLLTRVPLRLVYLRSPS